MSSLPLYIVGAGAMAREVYGLVEDIDPTGERFSLDGFIDLIPGGSIGMPPINVPVCGEDQFFNDLNAPVAVALGIGSPHNSSRAMRRHCEAATVNSIEFPVLVHPTAVLRRRSVELGRGTMITAGCVLTTHIACGEFNIFNWNVTVGHDCRFGAFNIVNPGCNISGDVSIGDRNLIGANATILQGLTIGDDCIVGAGSVVTKDLESGHVYLGAPARSVSVNELRG